MAAALKIKADTPLYERLARLDAPLTLQQRQARASERRDESAALNAIKLHTGLDSSEALLALQDDRVRYMVIHESETTDLLGALELTWQFRRHLDIILGALDPEAPPPTPEEREWAEQVQLEFSTMHPERYELLLAYRYQIGRAHV